MSCDEERDIESDTDSAANDSDEPQNLDDIHHEHEPQNNDINQALVLIGRGRGVLADHFLFKRKRTYRSCRCWHRSPSPERPRTYTNHTYLTK